MLCILLIREVDKVVTFVYFLLSIRYHLHYLVIWMTFFTLRWTSEYICKRDPSCSVIFCHPNVLISVLRCSLWSVFFFSCQILWCLSVSFRPSVLDNFALLSGQLNTINKLLKNEKTPSFRNQVIIPLLLSPDRDEDLAVSSFNTERPVTFLLIWGLLVYHCCSFSIRNSRSSVSQCSAMRLYRTTCGLSLIRRWRSRRNSWVQMRHVLALRWPRSVGYCTT